jgi:hypothetical protein
MATEDILIRYRADVSQLEADINKVIASQEELTAATNQNTQAQTKAANSAEFAAKKRAQLLEQEVQKLEKLQQAQKLAFDPRQIEKYNRQIEESQKRIELLSGKISTSKRILQAFSQEAIDQFKAIGIAAAGIFSIQSILNFSRASFNAFLDAEKAAEKLKFAIVDVGGETEAAYNRLIKQSQELQSITVFGDDDIQNAQAALANYGLAADEIENLIPKLLDFATVAGTDLASAVSQIGAGLEGSGREFKKYGIEVDAAKTRQQNLNTILEGFTKFAGSAANATNTVSGRLQQQSNIINDLQEQIGQKLAPAFLKFQTFALKALSVISDLFGVKTQTAVEKTTSQLRKQQSEFNILSDTLKKTNISQQTRANLIEEINQKYGDYLPKLLTEKSTLEEIEAAQAAVNKQIEGRVLLVALEDRIAKALENAAAGQALVTKNTKELTAAQKDLGDNAAAVANKVNLSTNAIAVGEGLIKSTEDNIAGLKNEYEELRKKLGIVTESTNKNTSANIDNSKSVDEQKKAAEEYKKLLESLDNEIKKVTDELNKRKIEIIPADSQKAQEDRIKALADLNEKSIQDEINAKIKLVQQDAKLSEQQKQDLIKKYEELKQARLDLAQFNEQNELNIINAQQVARIEAAVKQIDDLNIEQALVIEADKVEAANEAVAKSFEDLGEAITLEDFALAKDAATARTKALNQALIEENNINKTRIENARDAENAKVQAGDAAEAERKAIKIKYDNQIANADKELQNKLDKNNEDLTDNIDEQEKALLKKREDRLFQYADATAAVLSELTNLYSQFSENRIKSIEDDLQKEIEAIDLLEERNQEAFEQGIISQAELKIAQDQARQQRVNAELAAEKKIKEEKKKAAQLEKANALVQIAIDTARNIVQQPGVLGSLIPFWAILGAAQAAAVLAQPIPYAVGSKDTGEREHMARVGEHGEEFIWMPSNSKVLPARQTKKYSDVIDAMYDNRLDDFIYKNYVTPALMNQKQKSEAEGQRSFADNLAKSIYFNGGLNATDMEQIRRKGQRINNVDEIAQAIARQLPKYDPYRN